MSANDAAVNLAERISGDIPKFIERMKKEAKALGMNDYTFKIQLALPCLNITLSAADLARLGASTRY